MGDVNILYLHTLIQVQSVRQDLSPKKFVAQKGFVILDRISGTPCTPSLAGYFAMFLRFIFKILLQKYLGCRSCRYLL